MAPRTAVKKTGEVGEVAEGPGEAAPRRSGRIAAIPQPAVEVVTKKKAPAKKKAVVETEEEAAGSGSKKRAAPEDEAKEESVAKKSKGDAEAESAPVQGEAVEAAPSAAASALATIDIGDSLPNLILKNEKGEDVQVSELAAEKGVVFFLVPRADTPGCTNQACGFRDIYPDFTAHNFTVYCLSADTPTAQSKWQTKKSLPYPLLSDPKRVLITALGAGTPPGKTKRSHFIFAKGGKLVSKKLPVSPAESPKLALEFVKSLESAS